MAPTITPPIVKAPATPVGSFQPALPGVKAVADHFPYAAGGWGRHDKFANAKDKAAYAASLGGKSTQDYDPQHVLERWGPKRALGAPGRSDADMLKALVGSGFSPAPEYMPGPSWFGGAVQDVVIFVSSIWTGFGDALSWFFNLFVSDDMGDKKLPPYGNAFHSAKINLKPEERYFSVVRASQDATTQNAFDANFHEGSIARVGNPGFGTFDIAKSLGFNPAQATRMARADYNVDTNETPMTDANGKTRHTESENGGDLQFHFNRAGSGEEDTRLVAATTHLDRAVARAQAGEYDAAEMELGIGLHSLQDMFAHGQIRPITHGFAGDFPDLLAHDPVQAYEAQLHTEGYLREYLARVMPPPATAPKVGALKCEISFSRVASLADLPNAARDLLAGEDIRFFSGFAKIPAELGFGPNESRDVDGDGAISSYETAGARADGTPWASLPGGYNTERKVGFIAPGHMTREVARHELMHALVARLSREPRAQKAMQDTFQKARDNGVFDLTPPSLQEFFAESLANMDNEALSRAICMLRSGRALG